MLVNKGENSGGMFINWLFKVTKTIIELTKGQLSYFHPNFSKIKKLLKN